MTATRHPLPDAAMLRRWAVEADVDPRSLKKLLRGEEVKGMAGRRAKRALIGAGLLSEDTKGTVR